MEHLSALRTARILKSLPASDLDHLAALVGICPIHYNTHEKRAHTLAIYMHRFEGVSDDELAVLNVPFLRPAQPVLG